MTIFHLLKVKIAVTFGDLIDKYGNNLRIGGASGSSTARHS